MISKPIEQFIASFSERPIRGDWEQYDGPRFKTNSITIKVGSFYERIRYAVDYQEEHMLRRLAIERIIRRLFLFNTTNDIGRAVLEELVRGSYIENDSVPESLAEEIVHILSKYKRLEELTAGDTDVVWSYAAIEVEQLLFSQDISERTFTAMTQSVVQYMRPKEAEYTSDADFNLAVYIACRRIFLKENHVSLSFALFKTMVPEWRDANVVTEEVLQSVAGRFEDLQNEIKHLMNEPMQWKISTRLNNENIYFALLSEIGRRFGHETTSILEDPERLSEIVHGILENTYKGHQLKVSQSATRAVTYVLITKIIIGLAVEVPYEWFILGHLNHIALTVNIIFPPLLLRVMTQMVKYPDEENTREVIRGLQEFIEGTYGETQYVSVAPKTSVQKFGNFLFVTTFFLVTFGGIISVLRMFNFNPASIFLFLLFLCIVTFMGLRIRSKAVEWTLEKEDESFSGLLWFLFVLPIMRTGRWISERLSSVNVFVFFLDFILETPFKFILGSFDSFISYVKETKKEGL